MKKNLEVNEITLVVNGREEKYSKKELVAKLERLAELEKSFFNKNDSEIGMFELSEKPTDGKCFKVNPTEILKKESLFSKIRDDRKQENTRNRILKAIHEVKKNPDKYAIFYLLIPKKEWIYEEKNYKTVEEQREFAENLGGYMSNWITEPLVWAQRIINNETWKTVCNDSDTLKWYRIVMWENGKARLVGGSSIRGLNFPASEVFDEDYFSNDRLEYTVPSIILKSLKLPKMFNF